MAALAATNSATPSLQSTLIRARLETARREEKQAESTVQDLRAQVDAAETEYGKRQDQVRSLSDQSRQSDATYSSQVRSGAVVPAKTQELIVGLYQATSSSRQADGNGLKSNPTAAPVVNAQGQATGRIVNFSA
ncbi:hypothetical protein [Rhodoferax sp.]|uniref:hypothetical protein n=1 Tax=Rhodoferax sp. TaxID=50421 RepID=UPI002849945A|nr:hypothetical protein [Rhodoferax sp.]MDR3370819.1 hypothetical protein [Rhodoferax sp.]